MVPHGKKHVVKIDGKNKRLLFSVDYVMQYIYINILNEFNF